MNKVNNIIPPNNPICDKLAVDPISDIPIKKYGSLRERWDWILSYMVIYDPFVHQILMLMEKREDNNIPTMGVHVEGVKVILHYNPNFVDQLSIPALRFVITHEIFHVVLHHCTKRLPEEKSERSLWNKAADMAINSLITDTPSRHMPEEKNLKGIRPEDYGFESKLSMEQYIQLLRDKKEEEKGGEGEGGEGGEGEGGFDVHDDWKESGALKQIIKDKISLISKREKIWGSIPGGIQQAILAAQKSHIKWSKYLRYFIGTLISSTNTTTFKRPNKRFGFPYSGIKRRYIDKKCVYVDRSASISEKDLSKFLAEINRLAEIHPVDLQVFDTILQGKTVSFNRRHAKFNFKGGGGTSFHPIMKHAEKYKYKSIIILTDGFASTPEKPKFVQDILWVITEDGTNSVPWGREVKITSSKH